MTGLLFLTLTILLIWTFFNDSQQDNASDR